MPRISILLLLCGVLALRSQTITRVVNAASQDPALCPGVLAIVRGVNLPPAAATPVLVGGKRAAVVAATTSAYTIQIPVDAPLGPTLIQVGESPQFAISLDAYAPAVFAASPTGFGTLMATHADGSPVSENYPVYIGETISIFMTGLGATVPSLATGAIGPTNPLAVTAATPTVFIASGAGTLVESVAAPGQVGVYRVTVRVPDEPTTGTRGIVVRIGGFTSPPDHVSIPIAAAYAKPLIHGVVSAGGSYSSVQEMLQPGSWATIYGRDFCPFSLDWNRELSFGRVPTVLMGLRVFFGGQQAAIAYMSPTQLNVQVPEVPEGAVPVTVTFNNQSSIPYVAQVRRYAPVFFHWLPSQYVVATRYPDNALVGGPILGPGWVAAKPGDIITLWATGLGPTEPKVAPGVIVTGVVLTASNPTVLVGGRNARVLGSAMSPGLIGVYQIAIEVPTGLAPGDALLSATVGGVTTPGDALIYIMPTQ